MSTHSSGYELGIYGSEAPRSHPHPHPHDHISQLPPADKVAAPPPSDLLSLPLELHYLILDHLDLDSLLQLRRTSVLYYHVISPDFIRKQFTRNGRASLSLAACCNECLCAPGLDRLVVDGTLDASSWRSVCFRCWSNRITVDYHINPWPVVQIANGDDGYICHFCNWPVVNNGLDDGIDRLHSRCRSRRRLVLLVWFFMAFLQFGIGVLCAVLSWTHYKHQNGILIPSSIDFALAMISVVVFIFRICSNDEVKYSRLLFTELLLTVLRLPPVAYSARSTVVFRANLGLLPRFGFGVFLINL
ncbi:hypothetical protein F5Y01DRAFT_317216 [Xylaria sp. FL0043]|nr:hypothetical protein F5Y01DRAFT_317216 [Xylaria sp. FL0043]